MSTAYTRDGVAMLTKERTAARIGINDIKAIMPARAILNASEHLSPRLMNRTSSLRRFLQSLDFFLSQKLELMDVELFPSIRLQQADTLQDLDTGDWNRNSVEETDGCVPL